LDGRKTVKWACFESFWRVDLRNREIREKDRQMELLCSTIIQLLCSTIILSLQIRVRYLTDGAVLGSEAFVNQVFERNRAKLGKTRQSGARVMREADWNGLCVLRDLRKEVMISAAKLRE
jgi:hypothetical protein